MGFDDLKIIEAYRFLRSIADGTSGGATVDDAVEAARILDAMTRSVRTGGWVQVNH